jgi:hypothetical protein
LPGFAEKPGGHDGVVEEPPPNTRESVPEKADLLDGHDVHQGNPQQVI